MHHRLGEIGLGRADAPRRTRRRSGYRPRRSGQRRWAVLRCADRPRFQTRRRDLATFAWSDRREAGSLASSGSIGSAVRPFEFCVRAIVVNKVRIRGKHLRADKETSYSFFVKTMLTPPLCGRAAPAED